ncbi:unnamed protein product [Psylliodes chrysocephalus]|uniref:Innexin n=1 Tax=Psylliodes chrysocephalus TaxID=3402493 RepID=A0A9P0GHI1_9CUCU|nr:unnamed protein product [Psylliodes chrysocephala]
MLDIFRGLKALIRVSHIHIDSPIFRLHYSLTSSILIAFSLIVTTRQYVGNPIDCIHTKDIPEDVFNTFCWIHSTFTVATNKQEPVANMYLPGIRTSHDDKDKKLYKYYQWVCFCLFFQESFDKNLPTKWWSLDLVQNFTKAKSPAHVQIAEIFWIKILLTS